MPNNAPTPPSWLPDWKDETAYTDHGDDLEAWAWEFLRRNPDYQADFARWAALPEEWTVDGISGLSPKYAGGVGEFTPMLYCQPAENHPAMARRDSRRLREANRAMAGNALHGTSDPLGHRATAGSGIGWYSGD